MRGAGVRVGMVATANVQVECEHGVCRPKGALTPGAVPEKEKIDSAFLEFYGFQGNFTVKSETFGNMCIA